MNYYLTKSGIIVNENNVVIIQDDNNPLYQQYVQFLRSDGTLFNTDFEPDTVLELAKKEDTKARYEVYKMDGWEVYQNFRADIVAKIEAGELTEGMAFIIENYLSVAYDKIAQNGDWKTGRFLLNDVLIAKEHSFVDVYKSIALQEISNYIQENYP